MPSLGLQLDKLTDICAAMAEILGDLNNRVRVLEEKVDELEKGEK